jgi:hypothetical protein
MGSNKYKLEPIISPKGIKKSQNPARKQTIKKKIGKQEAKECIPGNFACTDPCILIGNYFDY